MSIKFDMDSLKIHFQAAWKHRNRNSKARAFVRECIERLRKVKEEQKKYSRGKVPSRYW